MSHRKAKVYGLTAPFVSIGLDAPAVTNTTVAPTTADHGTIGDLWVDRTAGASYMLVQIIAGSHTWALLSVGSGDIATLTGDAGGAIGPDGTGTITLAGGTNLATSGAGTTITFNMDAAITLATSVTAPTFASAAAMAINPVGALTVTGGAAIDINAAGAANITLQMGDAIGGNVVDFENSASATVASLNSNGQFSAVNVDAIIGAVTPAAGTFTTLAGTTSVTSPIFTTGAGAATNIRSAAAQNIVIRMGDAIGGNRVSFTNSADAEVFSVDSNGGLPTIGGALTVTGLITGNGSATINTAGAALNLGTDNAAGAVNIGTGTTIRAIGIGNVGGVAHTVAIGAAAAGAITVNTGAGISLSGATASSFSVTGAAQDLTVASTTGGVNITSGEAASATGITLDATAANGGVTIDAGSGGVNIATTVGCTVVGIGDIAPTAARTITVGGGTVVTAAITDTVDIGPDGATTNADSVKTVNVNAGGVTLGQVLTNVATGAVTSGTHTTAIATGNRAAGTMALNVMTGTGTKTANLGNADALTTLNIDATTLINDSVNAATSINTGTSTGAVTIGNAAAGIITIDSDANFSINADDASTISVTAGTLALDSSGALSINSSGGAINIGNNVISQAVNVGIAGARTVTVGSATGASSTVIDTGTGNADFGVSATAHTTRIGSTTGASATTIQAGTGEITMTGTVKEVTSEFTTRSGDFVTFTQSPILQSNATTGAAPTGATGDVNLMICQEGMLMEQFILGGGETIIAPRMTANGLNVALDLTVGEGAEYNFGAARTNSRHAFTIGTSAAFFFECRFRIADMSGADPYVFGFRRSEANNATFADYTDKASIGMRATTSATQIVLMTELNSAGETITNTTDVWGGDGSTNTLQVLVSAAGVVTYTINGLAPTVTAAFTFDNADVVVPFFRLTHAAVAPGAVEWVWMKIGFQA